MAKWDIDKAFTALEGYPYAGTSVSRVLMDVNLLERNGIRLSPKELEGKEAILVWCLALGILLEPKVFVYGTTIRGAYLKARKILRVNREAAFLANVPPPKKRKPRDRKPQGKARK